jgi:hypothetical protein
MFPAHKSPTFHRDFLDQEFCFFENFSKKKFFFLWQELFPSSSASFGGHITQKISQDKPKNDPTKINHFWSKNNSVRKRNEAENENEMT